MIPRTPVCFSHARLFRNIPYSSVIIRMKRLFAAGRTRPQIVRIVNPEKKRCCACFSRSLGYITIDAEMLGGPKHGSHNPESPR